MHVLSQLNLCLFLCKGSEILFQIFRFSKTLFLCWSSSSLLSNCLPLLEYCEVLTVMMNLLKGTSSHIISTGSIRIACWTMMRMRELEYVTSFSSTLIESTNTNHQKPPKIQVAYSFGYNAKAISLAIAKVEEEWSLIMYTCSSLSCFPLINVVDDGSKWWQLLVPGNVSPSQYLAFKTSLTCFETQKACSILCSCFKE